jgi:hypothetical protein
MKRQLPGGIRMAYRALIAIETVKNRPSAKQPHKASGSPDFGAFPAGPAMLDSCGVHPKGDPFWKRLSVVLFGWKSLLFATLFP